jgi:hypothetical protein
MSTGPTGPTLTDRSEAGGVLFGTRPRMDRRINIAERELSFGFVRLGTDTTIALTFQIEHFELCIAIKI